MDLGGGRNWPLIVVVELVKLGFWKWNVPFHFQKPKGCEIGLKIPILSQMTEISLGFH